MNNTGWLSRFPCCANITIGTHFGDLEILWPSVNRKWKCQCKCGIIENVYHLKLHRGRSIMCRRCRKKATMGGYYAEHRKACTVWRNMKRRCEDPLANDYKSYGARGVKVCERWQHLGNFISDMGDPPTRFQIDRINTNGDYEPSNCRWVSRHDQNRNLRRNRFVLCFGKRMIAADAAKIIGWNRGQISKAMKQLGWPENFDVSNLRKRTNTTKRNPNGQHRSADGIAPQVL